MSAVLRAITKPLPNPRTHQSPVEMMPIGRDTRKKLSKYVFPVSTRHHRGPPSPTNIGVSAKVDPWAWYWQKTLQGPANPTMCESNLQKSSSLWRGGDLWATYVDLWATWWWPLSYVCWPLSYVMLSSAEISVFCRSKVATFQGRWWPLTYVGLLSAERTVFLPPQNSQIWPQASLKNL